MFDEPGPAAELMRYPRPPSPAVMGAYLDGREEGMEGRDREIRWKST